MKTQKSKKIVSIALAASMLLSSAGTVFAGGDTLPPREGEQGYLGENQPTYHGHRADDILNWAPETDEYADFMRADVPLQERNDAYTATQTNPSLDQKVQSLALSEDYGNEFFNPTQYNDQFSQYLFNFWQYLDIRAAWHGVVTNPTPESLFNPEAPWYERDYEFGVLNIPNPAYTNAAHKNGVKSIGCIFFPRTEHTDDYIYKDENGRFPLADKFVEIANYYGFDGYFINAEEALPASFMPVYEEFCRAMTEQGLYIQVYASNIYGQSNQNSWGRIDYYNKDATQFSNWIKGTDDETIAANSLYMNPDPNKSMVDGSVNIMNSLGLDAKETVFNTLEAGQTGFSGTRGTLYNLYDENLVPRTGIANLGAGTVWAHLDEQLFGHSGNNSYAENRRSDPDYQKYIIARERAWWAGSMDSPTYSGGKGTLSSASLSHEELLDAVLNATFDPVAVANSEERKQTSGAQTWRGISAFISERSVINGANFYTNFNTGHGMQYFVDGAVSNDNEWSNINVQNILPTWQWWIDTESENRLTLDFDYGEKYNAAYDYTQVGAYKGGSSLAIFGNVDAQSDIRLYKTDLDVTAATKMNIVYNKTSKTDDSALSLVLYLEDGKYAVRTVYVPIVNTNRKTNGWTSTSLNLSAYAGETVAAFGLSVKTNGRAISDYQINIGEMIFTDNTLVAPAAPTGLSIEKAFNTNEVYLSWDLGNYDEIDLYNIYAVYEDGKEVYVGGSYDDIYYIKSTLYDADKTTAFKVTAVGKDGKESAGTTVAYNADTNAKNLTTEAQTGYIDVNWTNPDMDYASIQIDITLPYNHDGNEETYTTTIAKNATSAKAAVPVADGSKYNLRLSYLDADGKVISATDSTGMLKDLYCAPYEGKVVQSTIGKGWKLTGPTTYDWWHLTAIYNGKTIKDSVIRGKDDLTGLKLNGDFGCVEGQLEDFNGNKSEITRVYYGAEDKAVDETVFPDAELLAAVKEQVGDTMNKVIEFDGTLDLSGLDIADLTGLHYFEHLTGIDFTNSSIERITSINVLPNLSEITVTGCAELQILDLSNSSLEKINCEDPEVLKNLVCVKLENSRFDFSEGTPEREFVEAIEPITEGKDDILVTLDEETNYAEGCRVISGDNRLFNGNDLDFCSGTDFEIDLGSEKTIEKWALINYMAPAYGFKEFTVSVSHDGENYEEAFTAADITTNTAEDTLDTPITGRYFKIHGVAMRMAYTREFKLIGRDKFAYPAGVTYDGQKPTAYPNVPETVRYDKADAAVNLAAISTSKTIRGTDFADLADADFIAEGWAESGCSFDVIYVNDVVTNEIPLDKSATYNVAYVNFGVENEVYNMVVTVGDETGEKALEEAKNALAGLIETAEGVDRSKYTDETVKALEDALAKAKDALANAETAEELWNAYDALEDALNGLVEKTTGGNDSESPDTGDYESGFVAMIMLIAAGVLTSVFFVRKRKHS